jgi:hypothetical protein
MKTGNEGNQRKKWDVGAWVGLGGLLFGMVSFGITLFVNQREKKLERQYDEAVRFRVGISYMKYKPSALATLIRKPRQSGPSSSQQGEMFPVVFSPSDEQPDDHGRLGSWPSFVKIWDLASKDPATEQDQEYWFLSVTNRGSDVIDAIHLRFTGEKEEVVISNFKGGAIRLVPLEVSGRHTDLTRTRVRKPADAWFTYQPPTREPKRHPLLIPEKASLQTTNVEGRYEALPIF